MLPLLGPNGTSWPWPMQRIPSGRACWPVGIYRFDYEEGQRCFSSLSHKGGLVQHQDNGTSKWHVKLTRLCNNSSLWFDKYFCALLHICKYLHFSAAPLFACQILFQRKLAYTRFTSPNESRRGENEKTLRTLEEKRRKELIMLEGKCWPRR